MKGVIVIVGLAACAPPELNVGVEVPDGIDWVAGVAIGQTGQVIGATGLFATGALGSQLVVLSEDTEQVSRIVVLGWVADTLIRATGGELPSAEELTQSLLVAAAADQPIMPAPDFGADTPWPGPRIATPIQGPINLALHARWLPQCPNLTPRGRPAIESCTGVPCGPRFEQTGCELQADLDSCLPGAPEHLAIGPRGGLSAAGSDFSCDAAEPSDPSSFALDCRGCAVVGHHPPFYVPFQVSPPIQVVAVDDPTARHYPWVYAIRGSLIGIVALPRGPTGCRFAEPRIVALTREDWGNCASGQELVVIDPESTLELGRVPVNQGCVAAIFPDPTGSGVLVAFDRPLAMGRFDCDLAPVAHSLLVAAELGSDPRITAGGTIPGDPGLPAQVFLSTSVTDEVALIEIDPIDLSITRTFLELNLSLIRTIDPLGPGRAALGVSIARTLVERTLIMDFNTDPPGTSFSGTPDATGHSKVVTAITSLPRTDVLIASYPRVNGTGIVRIGTAGKPLEVEVSDYLNFGTSPSGSYPWRAPPSVMPEAEDFVLIATTMDGADRLPETTIGLLDVANGHFLPGRARIGYGPVGKIVESPAGTLWLPLVWQGALVRVRPSAPQRVDPE